MVFGQTAAQAIVALMNHEDSKRLIKECHLHFRSGEIQWALTYKDNGTLNVTNNGIIGS
jgi:hypothetical protein